MNMANRKQVIVLVVLAVVLFGALGRAVYKSRMPTPPPPAVSTPTAAGQPAPGPGMQMATAAPVDPARIETAEVDIDALLRDIEVVTFDYAVEKIERDPMAPLVGGVRTRKDPRAPVPPPAPRAAFRKNVTGIIWDEHDPVAVVDDQIVPVGHIYPNGIQIVAIERTRVVFKVGDSLIPVEMKEL